MFPDYRWSSLLYNVVDYSTFSHLRNATAGRDSGRRFRPAGWAEKPGAANCAELAVDLAEILPAYVEAARERRHRLT